VDDVILDAGTGESDPTMAMMLDGEVRAAILGTFVSCTVTL
jgi:hypothetical protein